MKLALVKEKQFEAPITKIKMLNSSAQYMFNLICGMSNGSISIWNVQSDVVRSVATLHNYAVSSLLVKDEYMLTGDARGFTQVTSLDSILNIKDTGNMAIDAVQDTNHSMENLSIQEKSQYS
jgi:hypothetical protein